MAHKEQFEFIRIVKSSFPACFEGSRVLEIGSLDINGSVRHMFVNCEYIGLDVADGKGVDVVCQGQDYNGADSSFDVVISCEAMEHNPQWQATIDNMIRLTRPGGLVVISCATLGRLEHGTARSEPSSSPLTVGKGWTYYRNLTRRDLKRISNLQALASWDTACNWDSYDLYFLGLKSPASPEAVGRLKLVFKLYRNRFWTSLKWLRRASRKRLKFTLFGLR